MPKIKGRGRRKGSQNKGYFYRAGRGWYAKDGTKFVPLTDEAGNRLKGADAAADVVKDAYARWRANRNLAIATAAEAVGTVSLAEVCDAYLAKAADEGSEKTFKDRSNTLYDLCMGLPPRFRGVEATATNSDRIHVGLGGLPVSQLIPLHVDQWLRSHPNWDGGRRTHVQAVKRALNYAVEAGLIPANPLKGYKTPKVEARVTYLTPDQEAAMCQRANPQLAIAIKVCIRTGARPGCEFAKLTAKHVIDQGDRMEWVFQPTESKTKKLRIIRITDSEILTIVRNQIAKHPSGPIFRNTEGTRWTRPNLTQRFRFVKVDLEAEGIEFDQDCCMYSCRHTYAKRTLQGYWSGKVTNIETLARLMGNSPQVCRDHYLQWCESYNEPLWDAC